MESLLDQGADIHATFNIAVDGHRWEGVTPLHVATLNPDMAVAELLARPGCRYPRCSNGQRSLDRGAFRPSVPAFRRASGNDQLPDFEGFENIGDQIGGRRLTSIL